LFKAGAFVIALQHAVREKIHRDQHA
jgi:hypothetical protein